MNAAARIEKVRTLSQVVAYSNWLRSPVMFMMLWVVIVLLSSLSAIYITHETRLFYALSMRQAAEHQALQIAESQLLLERGTLIREARVQQIATQQLKMVLPQSVVIIRAPP